MTDLTAELTTDLTTDLTIIVLPGSFGSGVAGTLDILRSASANAARVGAPVPRWRICSMDGGPIRLHSGLFIETVKLPPTGSADHSIWVIPGVGINGRNEVQAFQTREDVQRVVAALRAHGKQGGRIAAGCSAVFLLGLAGLLDGQRVTTAWWLAPMLQQMYPHCQVDAADMVCAQGNLVTAGAAFAQKDLMLYLLRELCGAKLVDLLSRFLLVDAREGQSQYVVPEVLASGDLLVAKIVERVESGLPDMPSVATLAAEFLISERTLARHIHRATGQSPRALLQTIRLRRARTLLEQSRLPIEEVAAAVGYGDATALRRLMRRATGNSPREYRR